jgi:hypothetical protein
METKIHLAIADGRAACGKLKTSYINPKDFRWTTEPSEVTCKSCRIGQTNVFA